MKIKRGQKLCKNCNNVCGARSKVCKHCNKEFEVRTDPVVRMKSKRTKAARKGLMRVDNWRELKPKQTIYFNGRSGNYYLKSDGTKDYDTPKGTYRVYNILEEGIGVFGNRGYVFMYMGKERKSKWGEGIYHSPHKIYVKKDSKIAQDT